jgi:hypothetical protein
MVGSNEPFQPSFRRDMIDSSDEVRVLRVCDIVWRNVNESNLIVRVHYGHSCLCLDRTVSHLSTLEKSNQDEVHMHFL